MNTMVWFLDSCPKFLSASFIDIFIPIGNIRKLESWQSLWADLAKNVIANMSYNTFFNIFFLPPFTLTCFFLKRVQVSKIAGYIFFHLRKLVNETLPLWFQTSQPIKSEKKCQPKRIFYGTYLTHVVVVLFC